MVTPAAQRIFIEIISEFVPAEVRLRGWVYRLRILGKTAFVILRDCSGEAQCVIASEVLRDHKLKVEDVVEILGNLRAEPRRAKPPRPIRGTNRIGWFGDAHPIPAVVASNRTVGDIFRMQAAILASFRDALNRRRFTEIVTSKIVSGGTEGGSNLFEIKYFNRVPTWRKVRNFIRKRRCRAGAV